VRTHHAAAVTTELLPHAAVVVDHFHLVKLAICLPPPATALMTPTPGAGGSAKCPVVAPSTLIRPAGAYMSAVLS
jgi:hypothetical protein